MTEFDLNSWSFAQNPYAYYEQLRKKGNVHYIKANNCWLIVGFNEVLEVLSKSEFFSSEGENPFDPILLNADPPKHTENRKVLSAKDAPFSNPRINKLEESNREIASHLIEKLKDKEVFDVLKDFSMTFSSLVILKLLGLSTENSLALKEWSQQAISTVSLSNPEHANNQWLELKPIIELWVEESMEQPNNKGLSEIIFNPFAQANFSKDDILNLTKVLLLGGNETTPKLISSTLLLLLRHDSILQDYLQGNLALESIIQESLRLEAPTQIVQRHTTQNIEIGGKSIPKDSLVFLSLGAANRDPKVFEDANQFKPSRNVQKILSFGYGPHYCIGAHLAKQEAKIALELILDQFPHLHLDASNTLTYQHSSHVRGLNSLVVRSKQNSQKSFENLKSMALDLIQNNQTNSGEFPTLERYPNQKETDLKNWHHTAESPFVHANILYSLLQLKKNPSQEMISKAIAFLKSKMEIGGVWRFWEIGDNPNNVPADIDDTAVCSKVLALYSSEKLDKKKLIINNIGQDGRIKTWFQPTFKTLLLDFSATYKWIRERKFLKSSLGSNLLNFDDYELGVMANALMFLGENNNTKASVKKCISMWKSSDYNSQFYHQPIVIIYHLSRAYKEGVKSFEVLKEDFNQYISAHIHEFSFPHLLLSALTLEYMGSEASVRQKIKSDILRQASEDDFKFFTFEYFASKDRNYIAGSEALGAAWFLELLDLWES